MTYHLKVKQFQALGWHYDEARLLPRIQLNLGLTPEKTALLVEDLCRLSQKGPSYDYMARDMAHHLMAPKAFEAWVQIRHNIYFNPQKAKT